MVAALRRATAFLAAQQLPSGELPVYASTDPTLATGAEIDPSIFPSALAAWSLSFWPDATGVRDAVCDFLEREVCRGGLWRHWPRIHPHHASLPPDLDDTSCSSLALAGAGRTAPDNRPLLLANRDGTGRFFTWVAPRLRWSGARHLRITMRQLLHAPTLFLFFKRTSAAPRDVDAVVNANTLFHLGGFEGDTAVVEFLLAVLRDGRERACDKWYDDPFVIWYFLARALARRSEEARRLLVAKLDASRPGSALDAALALCARLWCDGQGPADSGSDRFVALLLAQQRADGAWPRVALYHGGRARQGDGFGEPHPDTPRWGSEAVTTAFAVEGLARWLVASDGVASNASVGT